MRQALATSCVKGLSVTERRTPSSPPVGRLSTHLRERCIFAGVPIHQNGLVSAGLDPHTSAGVLHCCRASTLDCGGVVLSAPGGVEPCSEKLRLQLASVGDRFAGFKSSIAEDTRRRRLLEAERYRGALDHLITRCEELEQGLSSLKGEQAAKISRDAAELMARCKAIRAAFEAEIRSRNAREDAAGEKLEELVKNLDVKIESEIAARHQQVSSLKRDIAVLLRGDQPRDQFHAFVKEELEELRAGLAAATRAREEADDEILQAINEYTSALQRGLQSIGGLASGAAVA
ncbi:hypothetical protein, conserved [Eimeria acervulina]|uniref:SF-assemblin n=1 Tax=Eimeria acervulina TaxID=5801 RepID=U6GUJ1_EIMAC|nr:hypothetical protein, conserved [Eimeria acervulina]CDI82234.1 hypothetical protein, conserved [Eimeria acervulina]